MSRKLNKVHMHASAISKLLYGCACARAKARGTSSYSHAQTIHLFVLR